MMECIPSTPPIHSEWQIIVLGIVVVFVSHRLPLQDGLLRFWWRWLRRNFDTVAVAHDADEDGGGRGHYILRPSIGDVLLHMLHRHLETRPVPGIDLPPGPLRSRWPAVRPGLRYRLRFSGRPLDPGAVRVLALELRHRLLAFGSPRLVLLPVVVDRPVAVGAIHVASRVLGDTQVSSLLDLESSGEDPRLPVLVRLLPIEAHRHPLVALRNSQPVGPLNRGAAVLLNPHHDQWCFHLGPLQ